jgi:predicted nuclease with TOPRIM domain
MGMKEAYHDKMKARYKEWQAKIDLLKARAEQAEAEQKIKYYEQIESLRTKQQHLHEKLEELGASSEDAWEELKAGVELAWEDLKGAVERATNKFK